MATTVTEEAERVAQYVETKVEQLADKIKAIVAEGLAYDVEVRKDGVKVHEMPATIATILVGIGVLPPARLAMMVGILGATFVGYTFHVRKVLPTEKK